MTANPGPQMLFSFEVVLWAVEGFVLPVCGLSQRNLLKSCEILRGEALPPSGTKMRGASSIPLPAGRTTCPMFTMTGLWAALNAVKFTREALNPAGGKRV